jgi:hypothetical protein
VPRGAAHIADHPPLTLWLLSASDRWPIGPVELRVRVWAVLLSFLTGLAIVVLARARGAGDGGCTLAAWVGSWALLPMAGGFVTTPDGPLLLAIMAALLATARPSRGAALAGGLALLAGALSKVVALPVGALLAAAHRRASPGARAVLGAAPLLALPILLPSLRFQLRHAFGTGAPGGWSAVAAGEAVIAAVTAQALLWSPAVLWHGARGLRVAPLPDRALVAGLSTLVLVSAVVRGVPPEPNWWAPAALVTIVAAAVSAGAVSFRARRALLASVLLPTAIAAAHTARPFLGLPARIDPTARLHGWSRGDGPEDAAGVGPYGAAAERCVYQAECKNILFYFDKMNHHERSRY